MAPEIEECGNHEEISKCIQENPGKADIWALGKIALLMSMGTTEVSLQQIKSEVNPDLADFIL